jgi:hypothetical protein
MDTYDVQQFLGGSGVAQRLYRGIDNDRYVQHFVTTARLHSEIWINIFGWNHAYVQDGHVQKPRNVNEPQLNLCRRATKVHSTESKPMPQSPHVPSPRKAQHKPKKPYSLPRQAPTIKPKSRLTFPPSSPSKSI